MKTIFGLVLAVGLMGTSAFADSSTYRCSGVNAMDGTSLADGGAYVVTVDDGNQTASVSKYAMGDDHKFTLKPVGDLHAGMQRPTDSRYESAAFAFTRATPNGSYLTETNTGALTVLINGKAFQVLLCPRQVTPYAGIVAIDPPSQYDPDPQTYTEFKILGVAAESLYKMLLKNFEEDHCRIGTSHFVNADGMSCIKSGDPVPTYECRSIMDLKTGKISGDAPMCLQ